MIPSLENVLLAKSLTNFNSFPKYKFYYGASVPAA